MSYRYAAGDAVLEFFAAAGKRDREDLLKHFQTLADNPFLRCDYLQRTAAGREIQVKRFGRWLVSHWRDHPVMEVRILDVKRLIS